VSKCNVGHSFMFIYIHILSYYKLFLYFNLCLNMDVNEHERVSNITLRHKLKCGNNEFIAVLHFTVKYLFGQVDKSLLKQFPFCVLVHAVQYINSLFPHFNLCLSVMLDTLSCSFTSISFLTASYFFTLICAQV
jgi:hypothetical protein